jgi:raffinose/stachyose/melibiose transport system substrate-binding protein
MLVVVISAAILSACTNNNNNSSDSTASSTNSGTKNDTGNKKPVKLAFWGWLGAQSREITNVFNPAIEEFNKSNPYNATVEYLPLGAQFITKLTTEIAANSASDLFMTPDAGFLEPFVKAGKVTPLDDLLGKDIMGSFAPRLLDTVSFNGKSYAMPLARTSEVLYFNKEIFAKYNLTPPKTMSDLLNVTKTLKANGITPFALSNKTTWTGGLFINTIAYRLGGKQLFYDLSSGKSKFTDDLMVKASQNFSSLVQAGAFRSDANSIDVNEARQQFMLGQSAMWFTLSSEISNLTLSKQTNGTDNPIFGKVDFINWPSVEGGVNDAKAWVLSPDYAIAISQNSPNKDAANAFLKLLISKKYQSMLANISVPPATEIQIDKTKADPLFVKLVDSLDSATDSITFPDRILGQQTLGGELSNSTQELVAGKDPKTTMENLEKRVEPLRSK